MRRSTGLGAIGDDGDPVDWFFMYKLPAGASDPTGQSKEVSKGTEYMYFDSRTSTALALSDHLITEESSALQRTLHQVYGMGTAGGFVMYNDEPPTGKMDGRYGHTKGVLAFDVRNDEAFWLVHSTPKYPSTDGPAFPESGVGNGQSFLCITLEGLTAVETLATVMRVQQQPQIYASALPEALPENSSLRSLVDSVDLKAEDPPAALPLRSRGGRRCRLFAKNRNWGRDLWRQLIAEKLEVDLDVETWRRLELDRDTSGSKESDTGREDTEDVRYINLEHLGVPFEWHYTKDHSKWATSREYDWVIVADINRDKSQASRGGGAVAFQDRTLWDGLTRAEVIYDASADAEYQKLLAKRKDKKMPIRSIKSRGKNGGSRISIELDAKEVADLERIAKERKTKSLGETIKRLIKEST